MIPKAAQKHQNADKFLSKLMTLQDAFLNRLLKFEHEDDDFEAPLGPRGAAKEPSFSVRKKDGNIERRASAANFPVVPLENIPGWGKRHSTCIRDTPLVPRARWRINRFMLSTSQDGGRDTLPALKTLHWCLGHGVGLTD